VWKQQNQLGKYNIEAQKQREAQEKIIIAESASAAQQKGIKVCVVFIDNCIMCRVGW
jgi:hypothetical protein